MVTASMVSFLSTLLVCKVCVHRSVLSVLSGVDTWHGSIPPPPPVIANTRPTSAGT
jgi:hypothetical protein